MTTIVDYDIGNIAAIVNMLHRLGLPCQVTSNPSDIETADRIILPGNGAFDACMQNLHRTGLIPLLEQQVLKKGIPLLGICVGAQMLGKNSEEGSEAGLGWIDMQVKKFPEMQGLRVPHMGWNQVCAENTPPNLSKALLPEARFYFVHSYYMQPKEKDAILYSAQYGIRFAAAVQQENIVGVQFHPEKSHKFGKNFLAAFVKNV